jgi:hypothetical protein
MVYGLHGGVQQEAPSKALIAASVFSPFVPCQSAAEVHLYRLLALDPMPLLPSVAPLLKVPGIFSEYRKFKRPFPQVKETPVAHLYCQLHGAVPLLPEVGKHDGVARLRALLKSAPHYAPPPEAGEESKLARHFREVLEQPRQALDETNTQDLPHLEYQE